jgi:hypothetical protein
MTTDISSPRMVMPDTIAYLVTNHGVDRDEAERQVRAARDRGYYDTETYSIDYSTTGARWGKGRWQILADDPSGAGPDD